MILGNLSIEYSERIYNALLSLYPIRFRIRFAPEMLQLFRDCSRDALEKGQVALVVAVWLQVTRDLCVSVIRERGRELVGPLDVDHPLVAILDLLLIPMMVTANLLALGPILTLLVRGETPIPADQFIATSAFFSFAIGALAVLASVVITKLRPTVRLWVKLSA
jgi:phosphatidylglycerophosphate synthase